MATETPTIGSIANWFGSSRMVADRIGPELGTLPLVVVPFAGGMSELPYIDAGKIIVNDRHRHVVNLSRVIADAQLCELLLDGLNAAVFHPDTLAAARAECRRREGIYESMQGIGMDPSPSVEWAEAYFIATWMGRGGNSGTRGEFKGKLPVRYSPNGGGSAQRFWSAVGGLPVWHRIFGRCEFTCEDAFDVLEQAHDSDKVGVYVDAPWPDAGDIYAHPFDEQLQRRLAAKLATFERARVVVRFADHPLIRELYPAPRWNWLTYPSRAQTNGSFDEVLLLNGPSVTASAQRVA